MFFICFLKTILRPYLIGLVALIKIVSGLVKTVNGLINILSVLIKIVTGFIWVIHVGNNAIHVKNNNTYINFSITTFIFIVIFPCNGLTNHRSKSQRNLKVYYDSKLKQII